MPTSKSRIRQFRGRRVTWLSNQGMAIPLIICFVIFVGIFIGSMVYNRINIKRQTKTTFEYLAAHYMAQSALQHMYLKLRLLPNEAYDTSAVSLGLCPFDRSDTVPSTVGTKSVEPMKVLTGDICTIADPGSDPECANSKRGYPLDNGTGGALADFDSAGWGYKIVQANAITAHTKGQQRILVIEVVAEGFAASFTGTTEGGMASAKPRIERIRKTIEIRRQHDDF